MDGGLSMRSRAEVTTRYARTYVSAGKKVRGQILDEVVSVTGWSRDNARRRLTEAAKSPPGSGRQVATRPRRPRAPKYSYDATKVLQRVWAASGGQCGSTWPPRCAPNSTPRNAMVSSPLQGSGRLDPQGRYSPEVRAELLSMSAATIDRYLAPAKATEQLRGTATTKPSPLLRSSITVRKAGDEVEAGP